jgi:BMFP domain-containing protein YqiC
MRFGEDRRGREDSARYHFLAHQLSHHTTDAVELLSTRIAELEARLNGA